MVRSSWKPSARFPRTRRSRLILASARTRAWRVVLIAGSLVVPEEREHVVAGEALSSAEESQFDDEAETYDNAAGLPHHARGGGSGATGGQQVNDDQDAIAGAHG